MIRTTTIFIVCLCLISCSTGKMIETDLYFGQTRPDGSMITAQEWNQFKETHICRIFKEGSSTFSVVGNWFDPDAKKLITEPSYMVSHLHKKSELISKQIDSLRTLYKTLFQQQSVLRVDRKVKASF